MAKCIFPQVITNPNYVNKESGMIDHSQLPLMIVPCGKCYNCLRNRRAAWCFRLKHEARHSVISLFVTLSESEEFLHPLNKRDLQLLFKSMRKHGFEFTYYAIGEYGSKFGRPHYHIMFFSKSDHSFSDYYDFIKSYWRYGYIEVSECVPQRISYITHYHVRPKRPNNAQFDTPTFQLMSKGIGMQFLTPERLNYLMLSEDNIIHDFDGSVVNLPRYYRKKFEIPSKLLDSMKDDVVFVRDVARKRGYKDEFEYLRDVKNLNEFYLNKYNQQEKF